MVLFLLLFFSISVEAQSMPPFSYGAKLSAITKAEIQLTDNLLNRLVPDMISGKEREIRKAVSTLKSLPNVGKRMSVYETDSQVVEAGNIYFQSGLKSYKNLTADINSPNWVSLIFDPSLKKEEEMKAIVRDLRLSLVFFSLAGFDSLDGKNKYLEVFHQFQVLLATLFELYRKSTIEQDTSIKEPFVSSYSEKVRYLQSIRKFQHFYKQLMEMYFQVMEPSFRHLSWLRDNLVDISFKAKHETLLNNSNKIERIMKEIMASKNGASKSLYQTGIENGATSRASLPMREKQKQPEKPTFAQEESNWTGIASEEPAGRAGNQINGKRVRSFTVTKSGYEGERLVSEELAGKDKVSRERVRDLTATEIEEGERLVSKERAGVTEINDGGLKGLVVASDPMNMDSLKGLNPNEKMESTPSLPETFIADDKIDMEMLRGFTATKSSDTSAKDSDITTKDSGDNLSILKRLNIFCKRAFSE